MSDLIFGVNLVLPLFIVILVGLVLRRKDILNENAVDSISTIVYYIALPAKLFLDTATIDRTGEFNLKFVVFILSGTLIAFLILFIIVPIFIKDNRQASAMIHTGFRGNFVFIGVPLIESIIGKAAAVPISLILVFLMPLYNFLGVFLVTYFGDKNQKIKLSSLIIGILKNPMIIAILVGIPFSLLQIELPDFATTSLDILGRLSTPLALLLIGANLKLDVFKGEYGKIILITLYKTILQPIILVPLAIKLNFSAPEIVSIFVLFSMPSANNAYIMTRNSGGDADLASSITVASLIVTIITFPIGIFLLGRAGII